MALLVLSYPRIAPDDFEWIQSLRSAHDPRAHALVGPHFTLVFPTNALGAEPFLVHVHAVAAASQPIPFVLRRAQVVSDPLSEDTHVFLVPEEGFSGLVELHDQLYTGPLREELRTDIEYIPHIGVARMPESGAAQRLADELNAAGVQIVGSARRLTLAELASGSLRTIETIQLDNDSASRSEGSGFK